MNNYTAHPVKFVVVKPTAKHGHESTVLETMALLEEWVSGVDFSGLGGYVVGVEDTITKTKDEFWQAIEEALSAMDESTDNGTDPVIEIRYIPQMRGGS